MTKAQPASKPAEIPRVALHEQVAERLRAMGCPGAQGYWFGRPAPLEQLRGWHAP